MTIPGMDELHIMLITSLAGLCPTGFFLAIDNLRDRAMFETVYSARLRLSEIVHLCVQDIDSKQMRIFVHHGKGGKDWYSLLSLRNLEVLRKYWKQYRPNHPDGYLFYARSRDQHILTSRSVDNAFSKYQEIAHLSKSYTVRTLRHSCATLLLSLGYNMKDIQGWLGHNDYLITANTYTHSDYKNRISMISRVESIFNPIT